MINTWIPVIGFGMLCFMAILLINKYYKNLHKCDE